MAVEKKRVASGVDHLDRLLDGLRIGDNVLWYDDAGSLAQVFCMNFIQRSQARKKSLIYVSFDRSPKNLLEKLGSLADDPRLTILDCFTYGKGAGSEVFLKFYQDKASRPSCRIQRVEDPRNVHEVMDAFYGAHARLKDDVRFVFESLTGMQELWGGEEHIVHFYSHSCPRLYELKTIAYWIIEKRAHSVKLRAKINQIAQVAIDLSVKRGKASLTILKAENRDSDALNKSFPYWSRGMEVTLDSGGQTARQINLGMRLKGLRTRRGISQTELAKLVGVTPSTISQVESNLIYPSLPALFKMAEVLSITVGSFFQESATAGNRPLFPSSGGVPVKFPDLPKASISGKLLKTLDAETGAEPYLIEISPKAKLPAHFFNHKGHEIGHLLSGELQVHIAQTAYTVKPGDTIYLTTETPGQWQNTAAETARLFWIKIK